MDGFIIYADEVTYLKQQAHLDELANADGWKPETIADMRIGPRCTHVREALASGTFESSGLADKILRRHVIQDPTVAEDGVRRAIRVNETVERYDGEIDSKTGDVIDVSQAIAKLPADWAPTAISVAAPQVIK